MALPPIKFPSLKNSEDTPKAVLKTNVQGFSSIESNLSDIKGILQKQFEFNVDWQRKQNLADIERRNEEKSKGDKIASGKGTDAVVVTGGATGGSGGGDTDSGGGGAAAAAGFGLAGLASTLKGSLPFLTRGLSVLSGAKMLADGGVGVATADKDGQSKSASAIGNAIGGGEGGIVNAITQGLMGATLGFKTAGPVGAIVGGAAGGAAGAIGGEKITDALDDFQSEVAGLFGKTLEISPGRKKSIEKRVQESGKYQENILKEIESLTKTIEDTSNVSLEDRKVALEKRKEFENRLKENQENVARDKDILARDEMAVLDKQIESMKKKKGFTMEDQLQVEKLEKEKEKIRNSFDYQEDISDKIGEVGNNIGKSFMEMVDGIGSLFGKKGPGRGQFSRRNNKKAPQVAMDALDPKKTLAMHEEYNSAISGPPPMLSGSTESASLEDAQRKAMGRGTGTGEITGFTPEQAAASAAAMNALPMRGNEITGFSANQSNMMRRRDMQRRSANDSRTGEITGFTPEQAAASAAAMNALPMDADGTILGFSANQSNMMQRNRLRNRRPANDSGTGEITGFTRAQAAASAAAMNALPMDADGTILGFSANQSNMMRRRDMQRRSAGRVPTQSSNITSKQDLTPEKIAAAKATLDAAAAEAQERFTGPVLQSDGSMRGAKSLSYNKGTLGEDNDLMQNFGKGTPAVLHGNEAVLNEEQLANLARGIPLAAETLLKKVRSPSAEGVEANEAVSQFMKTGAGDMNKDIMKRIDEEGQFKSDTGESYRKDSKGNYVFGGSEGVYVYSPQGKLLSYSTPTIGGIKFKKDLKTGNVTQTFKGTIEDGLKVSRSKTFDESGVELSKTLQATQGGVTAGTDPSGKAFVRYKSGGLTVEGNSENAGPILEALEAALKETMPPMTPTNVVAPTDNSTVNNVVNNNSTVAPKPQARNQEPSSARYGGMMAGAY